MKKFLKKILILFSFVIALYIIYLLTFQIYLNSSVILKQINRHPEKVIFSYDNATSIIPFRLVVKHFKVQGKTSSPYNVTADSITCWLSPVDLLEKRVSLYAFTAKGIEYSQESKKHRKRRLTLNKTQNKQRKGRASIHRKTLGKISKKKAKWEFKIYNAKLSDIRTISIDDYVFNGKVDGKVNFKKTFGKISLKKGKLNFRKGVVKLYRTGETVLSHFVVNLSFVLHPYPYKKVKGKKVLSFLDSELSFQNVSTMNLSFLQSYLKRSKFITINGGEGKLRGHILVEKGLFIPGSKIEYKGTIVTTRMLDYNLTGKSKLIWKVVKKKKQTIWKLTFDFLNIKLDRGKSPYLFDDRAHLSLWGKELKLGKSVSDFQASISLKNATLPDLTCYNAYIPAIAQTKIIKGAGKITSVFKMRHHDIINDGLIHLVAPKNEVNFQDLNLAGLIEIITHIGKSHLKNKSFPIHNTQLFLKNVSIINNKKLLAKNWWVKAIIEKGKLTPKKKNILKASFSIKSRDFWPFFLLYVHGKNKLPTGIIKLVKIPITDGYGKIVIGKKYFRLTDSLFYGEKLKIKATITKKNKEKKGAFLLQYNYSNKNTLVLGLEIRGKKKKLKFSDAQKWYKKYANSMKY